MNSKIFIFFTLFLILSPLVMAESGVEWIIENDQTEDYSEFNESTDYTYTSNSMDAYSTESFFQFEENYYKNKSGDSYDPYINIMTDLKLIKSQIRKDLGEPETMSIVLLLYSLAALIQMGRVIAGKGDWLSFVLRVLAVFIFIESFPWLYSGIEAYAFQIEHAILDGQTGSEVLYSKFGTIYESFATNLDENYITGALIDGLVTMANVFSSIFCLSSGLVLSLIQTCILVALFYLGPILIALAIIPETDFTDSFISSFIQVLSWGILFALLVKIIDSTIMISVDGEMTLESVILLMVMNLVYALATFSIPLLSMFIFSGKNWGALAMVGMGLVFGGMKKMIFGNSGKGNLNQNSEIKTGKNTSSNAGYTDQTKGSRATSRDRQRYADRSHNDSGMGGRSANYSARFYTRPDHFQHRQFQPT